MTPVTKYHCPICDRAYDNPNDAKNCYKSPDRFKEGDIVWNGHNIDTFRIVGIPDSGLDGAYVEPVQELITAASIYSRREKQGFFMIGSFWCNAEKYPVAEAKKLVKELERRLNAARAFLEQVSK